MDEFTHIRVKKATIEALRPFITKGVTYDDFMRLWVTWLRQYGREQLEKVTKEVKK